ncbi:MAG: response regulator [Alphaproteobacteria bacterium CG_4_9_14_3_um_filter_47_13]|nr:MAG: response regulator [Alphaproteobacteria bacterium CG_4_9_14_3_um_filter_47_13]
MEIIRESPEHHFLTFLERIRIEPEGWLGYHFSLSKKILYQDMIVAFDLIADKLSILQHESDDIVLILAEKTREYAPAFLYQFTDGDIVFLAKPEKSRDRDAIHDLYHEMQNLIGENFCRYHHLGDSLYEYQKLVDARFLSANRMNAYKAMADIHRIQSLPIRRGRHEDAVILIVEDDRFSASYAANILNREYDIILAKTGEDAIGLYIEHAPDIVFLDIHLPGIDGLETLRALRRIDPHAYVFMLSGDTVKPNIIEAGKEGAAGFLKKPYGKERMLSAVHQSPFVIALRKKALPRK